MNAQEDKELRIVWVICIAIVLVSAFITFWSIMAIEEKPQLKPSKVDSVYVSHKTRAREDVRATHSETR